MSKTVDLETITSIVESLDLIPMIEKGFMAYSQGDSIVPPVGELQLEKGEVHIKYGFIKEQPYYVIKIASGFYGNHQYDLPSSNGCMLVFCQSTGQLQGILLDEGHLTDVRTAVAGAISAKYLAPKKVHQIGIVGTGIQAAAQLHWLEKVIDCHRVSVWGRSLANVEKYINQIEGSSFAEHPDFQIEAVEDLAQLQQECNLIVTTTPSNTPLLSAKHLQPGTHITAVGSDTLEKQELDSEILAQADLVVGDSISQCKTRGEISQAIRSNHLSIESVVELGNIISDASSGRTNDLQITVSDLTGVAVQDIQIASAVFEAAKTVHDMEAEPQ